MRRSVAVMEIRSSELAIFVGERGINNTFVFKASRTEPYDGYENGAFYDEAALRKAVYRALDSVEQTCGEHIRKLYIGVPGEFLRVVPREQVASFPKKVKIGSKQLDQLFEDGKEKLKKHLFIRAESMIYITADDRRVANPEGLYTAKLTGLLSYFYVKSYFVRVMCETFADSHIELRFLPELLAMSNYLIPPETRDEYALFLDAGYLSSTVAMILGNGVLAQKSFWAGKGQIVYRLMDKFRMPYDAACALLGKANLYSKADPSTRWEFLYRGKSYEIVQSEMVEAIKEGLDELCEAVGKFLEDYTGGELDSKPIYVTGEGLYGIRGALEHVSKRLNRICERVAPEIPFFNKPFMSSRIALMDMACEDNRKRGLLYRLLNIFGG